MSAVKKWSKKYKKLSYEMFKTIKLIQFKIYNLNIINNIYIIKKTNWLTTVTAEDILK